MRTKYAVIPIHVYNHQNWISEVEANIHTRHAQVVEEIQWLDTGGCTSTQVKTLSSKGGAI